MDRDAVCRLWASLPRAPAGTPGQDEWCLSRLGGLRSDKRSWAVGVEVRLHSDVDVVWAGEMRPAGAGSGSCKSRLCCWSRVTQASRVPSFEEVITEVARRASWRRCDWALKHR